MSTPIQIQLDKANAAIEESNKNLTIAGGQIEMLNEIVNKHRMVLDVLVTAGLLNKDKIVEAKAIIRNMDAAKQRIEDQEKRIKKLQKDERTHYQIMEVLITAGFFTHDKMVEASAIVKSVDE